MYIIKTYEGICGHQEEPLYLGWQKPAWDLDGYFWTSKETIDEMLNKGFVSNTFKYIFLNKGEALNHIKQNLSYKNCEIESIDDYESVKCRKRHYHAEEMNNHLFGMVIAYYPEKRYGFINGMDGKEYFIHYSQYYKFLNEDLKKGDIAVFVPVVNENRTDGKMTVSYLSVL